jgi:hypothetical protein
MAEGLLQLCLPERRLCQRFTKYKTTATPAITATAVMASSVPKRERGPLNRSRNPSNRLICAKIKQEHQQQTLIPVSPGFL